MTDLSDDILIKRFKQGDAEAFGRLYQIYHKRVIAIAYGVVRNQQDATDLCQDVFIKVYKNIDRFNEKSSFYTWIYRITVNQSIDFIRRRKTAKASEFTDDFQAHFNDASHLMPSPIGAAPGEAYDNKQLRHQIQLALDKLSPKHREVIVLREIEGLSYQEMSDVIGISIGTVMSRLHHARLKLQKLLMAYLRETNDPLLEK